MHGWIDVELYVTWNFDLDHVALHFPFFNFMNDSYCYKAEQLHCVSIFIWCTCVL